MRDATSCLLKGRSPRRCRIAAMGNAYRLIRRGRLEFLEADGGEALILLVLLLLLLLDFGTAACHACRWWSG